ncbi:MAG: putative sugar nucleotidyl transferase [Cytophagales bacterium]|nr:putative sugar nucleotidyl transferase [Cytophagales bacterium]
MNIILFDDKEYFHRLKPITYTRPVAQIRVGIKTIYEKWVPHAHTLSYLTQDYLSKKYPSNYAHENVYVNGSILPDTDFVASLLTLKPNYALAKNGHLLAYKSASKLTLQELWGLQISPITYTDKYTAIQNLCDIFVNNGTQLRADFEHIRKGRKTQIIEDQFTKAYHLENIFIEEGVKLRNVLLNAENGPIYIGKNADIQEGAIIRGAFAICEGGVINMGAKIRGDVTIGPYCKAGGEISNSIMIGYSNKAHDGFLGNSVIGEWCNIGADTNTSNLKNNYSDIKLWNYISNKYETTERMFCGLFMGDHTKCGINTMFNSGTTVGVSCNIFGGGFADKYLPNFSWGGMNEGTKYEFDKAVDAIKRTMKRREMTLTDIDLNILSHLQTYI